jgi:hypothetical protein
VAEEAGARAVEGDGEEGDLYMAETRGLLLETRHMRTVSYSVSRFFSTNSRHVYTMGPA